MHTLSAPFLLEHLESCRFFCFPREHLSFFIFRHVIFGGFFFFSEVFDAAMLLHVLVWMWTCLRMRFCVFVLYLELVVHSTLSPVRMDGDIPAEMRGGEGSSKGASRWPGRMGTEKKKCIRSHCASNVITGSDSSMWHAALPICQSEIGRVTNGYHCYFPQPPPPPPPVLMSVSFSSAGGEEWPKPGW